MARTPRTPTATVTHGRMRQRREGRWPSGNNRIRKTPISRIGGSHRDEFTATTTPPPGSEPGCSTRAQAAYASPSDPRTQLAPIAVRIQPILFRGCFWTIKAPTSGKSVTITPKPTLARALLEPQSLSVFELLTSSSELPQPPTTKKASSAHEVTRSVRSLSLMTTPNPQHPLQRGS